MAFGFVHGETVAPQGAPRMGVRSMNARRDTFDSDRLQHLPSVRLDLVESIRLRLRLGDYDTPERLDAALEQMIQRLAR